MLNDQLKSRIIANGASLVGFADLKEIDAEERDGFPFGISIAIALDPKIVSTIKTGPTLPYFAEYKRVNILLDNLGQSTVQFLIDKGCKAKVRFATFEEDPVALKARLPHKTVATRAGLGWIGKCALFITKQYGSAVRLVTVLADAPLVPGKPISESICADCNSCVNACPAKAITGLNWEPGLPRESFYDAFKCRVMARELSAKSLKETISLCGLCIVACPWTQGYIKKAES